MSIPADRNYIEIYKADCDCYVETGSYVGDSVTLAVKAGFQEIHSIDIINKIPESYSHGMKNITFHIGDSPKVLDELLPKLKDKKIFFFLDAHSMLTEGEEENYPLLNELNVIAKHCNNCVILIDDYLYMTHHLITGFSTKMIEKRLDMMGLEIEYLSNPIINNILLAR
jgi:hypothetical protein